MLSPSVESIRLFLHILAASVWVGGQIVLAGVVPRLRKVGPEATSAAANGFAMVAWPAFVLAFLTGIWNMIAAEGPDSSAWSATLGIKILLVVIAGFTAAAHSRSASRIVMAITGAAGGILAIVILFLGVLLSTNH